MWISGIGYLRGYSRSCRHDTSLCKTSPRSRSVAWKAQPSNPAADVAPITNNPYREEYATKATSTYFMEAEMYMKHVPNHIVLFMIFRFDKYNSWKAIYPL